MPIIAFLSIIMLNLIVIGIFVPIFIGRFRSLIKEINRIVNDYSILSIFTFLA
jgi:hypothetical protein